jgi:hypothetical protein
MPQDQERLLDKEEETQMDLSLAVHVDHDDDDKQINTYTHVSCYLLETEKDYYC